MSFITEAGQFSLTGNVGGAILPVLDNISILGSGLITVTGDPVLGTLTISGGGVTGMTEHAMVVGNAAGGITSLAVATDGQIPIGSTGNDVVLSTLTAGNNIGITNAAGSITIKVNGTTNHALQIGNATGDLTSLAVGSTGVILQGVVGADPSWSTATYPSTVALGDVLVASAANVIGVVNDVTNAGYVLTANVGAAPSFQAPPSVTYASDAETIAGTVTNKSIAPSNLKAKLGSQTLHGLPIGASDSVAIAWTAEPTDGQILIGKTGNQPVLATISSGNNITATAGSGTISIAVTGTTQHAVQVGGASGQLASLAVGTTGKYLRAATTADPAWSTLTLPDTVSKGDVLVASADNVVGSVAGATTAGYVLMANGAGSAPTFQALPAAGIASVSGTANQITASTVGGAVTLSTPSTFIAPGTIAATTTVTAGTNLISTAGNLNLPFTSSTIGAITFGGTRYMHVYDTGGGLYGGNLFIGRNCGNYTTTGYANYSLGSYCGSSLTSGNDNFMAGDECGRYITSGGSNNLYGKLCAVSLTQGYDNVAAGSYRCLGRLTTGNANVAIGSTSTLATGSTYIGAGYGLATGSESSNILINATGVTNKSNQLRIGDGTGTGRAKLNDVYISGIYTFADALGASQKVIVVDSNDKIGGVATLPPSLGGAMTWTEVTGTSQAAAVNNGYITNNVALVTFTLPATAAIGTEFKIQGKGAGLWKIAQGAGQQIYLGSTATSSGAGGYLEATDAHDAITLVCITADTVWATEAVVGNITVA